jgi:hypothetical protein
MWSWSALVGCCVIQIYPGSRGSLARSVSPPLASASDARYARRPNGAKRRPAQDSSSAFWRLLWEPASGFLQVSKCGGDPGDGLMSAAARRK